MKNFLIILLPVFIVISSFTTTQAQNYQLHAVFINSFMKYVKWPDNRSTGEFQIAVIGESPIMDHLTKLAEVKKINGRSIVVKNYATLDQVQDAHMLYIPETQADLLNQAISKFGNTGTMIITEKEGLGTLGSNINFIIRNGRLAFEMNLLAMEKSNLKVSTELARLAIEI